MGGGRFWTLKGMLIPHCLTWLALRKLQPTLWIPAGALTQVWHANLNYQWDGDGRVSQQSVSLVFFLLWSCLMGVSVFTEPGRRKNLERVHLERQSVEIIRKSQRETTMEIENG